MPRHVVTYSQNAKPSNESTNEQTLNIKEEIKVYECIRTIKGDSFSSEMNKKTNKHNKLGDEKGDS